MTKGELETALRLVLKVLGYTVEITKDGKRMRLYKDGQWDEATLAASVEIRPS